MNFFQKEIKTKTFLQNQNIDIRCPNGYGIEIISGMINGIPSIEKCSIFNKMISSYSDISSIYSNKFDNKQNISVMLTDDLLGGDPCPDKIKYSVIQYRCLRLGIFTNKIFILYEKIEMYKRIIKFKKELKIKCIDESNFIYY